MTDHAYYFDTLYPLQNEVLALLAELDTGFYLTGGTAASRLYLHHRFSDDLDLFVNDQPEFNLWAERLIQALEQRPSWTLHVLNKDERFIRLVVQQGETPLKIELINDVPAHIGQIQDDPILGRVDSAENILANKVTAVLGREEPKDLADIWGFCRQMGLSLDTALEDARSKAAGIFAPDLARALYSVSLTDWQAMRWISPPDADQFMGDLRQIAEELLLAE
jgi:hypothetical protein